MTDPNRLRTAAALNAPDEPLNHAKDRAASEREQRVLFARDARRSGMPRKAEEWRPLTAAEIAERLGVSRSTVRRYLAEIAEREPASTSSTRSRHRGNSPILARSGSRP